MHGLNSEGVFNVLNHESAPSNLKRFNEPLQPIEAQTYGFKGFPEMHMMEPKRPLRHQPSADITTDVNRYFRRDSPTEWMPPPQQAPPERRPSPPPQPNPEWLNSKRDSPPPQAEPLGTLSPRYKDDPQMSFRKPPVIRDPLRELTSAEKRKKIEEHYIAEQDLAEARRRREEQAHAKREEQQKADTRKLKFTELQMNKPPTPQYSDPPKYKHSPRYGDENREFDRVRSSMDQNFPERKEDILRQQEREIDELRQNLNQLERSRQYDTQRELNLDLQNENKAEMLDQQSMHLKRMQDEINKLKAADDISYRPGDRARFDANPRAQSVSHRPMCIFTSKPDIPSRGTFVGYLFTTEPQTERTWRQENRDREFWGESNQGPDQYLNISPRRRPVGHLYNTESTYKQDFDPPVLRKGRRVLGNPNKDPFEPYAPWGAHGGGAPMADETGQRKTRIQGSMGVLGRELSDSARARRAHKQELLQTIGEQAAYERARKEAEKAYARQGFVEVADVMRQQKVGYPKYKPSGLIASHHLPHAMSNPYQSPGIQKQREYHDFLASQIEEKNRNTRLGQLEEKRQAREHFRTQDGFFGKRGGGNRKGEDLRKYNLDKAIHNPQNTSTYAGGAPYAEFGNLY